MVETLTGAVGVRRVAEPWLPKVANFFEDQAKVVKLLSAIPLRQGGMKETWSDPTTPPTISTTGECPKELADAIWKFQSFWRDQGVFHNIDGVVDRGMHTLQKLNELASPGSSAGGMSGVSPEGQIDATACWAACLAWMTRATPGATNTSQFAILTANAGKFGVSGTISKNDLMTANAAGVLLKRRQIPPNELEPIIRAKVFPLLVGFASGPMSGHCNMLHAFEDAGAGVVAMEPWFPDPSRDPNFEMTNVSGTIVFTNKTTGAPFAFTGTHIRRPMSYYTSKPLGGAFVVGIPASLDFPP
jgi:hypothetical protein